MFVIDIFIGAFPVFIVLYHIYCANFRYQNNEKKTLYIIIANILYGRFLKTCFKVKRIKIVKKDFLYQFRRILNFLGSDYSFPSYHTVFYTHYFMRKITIYRAIFVIFICFGRVYYKHHTIFDVIFGVFFGILFNFMCKKVHEYYSEDFTYKKKKNK